MTWRPSQCRLRGGPLPTRRTCQRPLDECVVYDAGNGRADVPDPRGRRLLVDTSLPVMNNVAGERKLDGAPAIVRRSF